MKNIELKVFINDFREIAPSLRKIGAKYNRKLKQVDTYYDCKNSRLKIRIIDNTIFELISYQRPNRKGTKISNYHVTKIKPTEIETIRSGLEHKFGKKVIVKKQRNLWIYKHSRIHLDKVYGLGKFLELETVVKRITPSQARKEYNEIVNLLNLSKYKEYNKSYSDLLLSIGRP